MMQLERANFGLVFWFVVAGLQICQCYEQYGDVPNSFETVITTRNLQFYLKNGDQRSLKEASISDAEKQHESTAKTASTKGTDGKMHSSKSQKKQVPFITETTLGNDTNLGAIVTWTSYDTQVIFILTCDDLKKHGTKSFCASKANVYRSVDYGETFNPEIQKFMNTSLISKIFVSPLNRNLVFALDRVNRMMFWSKDEGKTYDKTWLMFEPASLSFHPTLSHFLLIKDVNSNAYLSNDTGKNWALMTTKIRRFYWSKRKGENASELIFERISMQNTKLPTKNYSLVYISQEPFHDVHLLDQTLGPIYPNSLFVKGKYIYIQRKTSAGNKRLFVHYSHAQHFEECELPTNELHLDYFFLQGDQDQIMLAALTKTGSTNLYVASEDGKQFSLILDEIAAVWNQHETVIDIHRVSAVPGTLIANQVGKGTLISYNNGGLWSILMPPTFDEKGKKIECYIPECIFKLSLYIKDETVIGWSSITASQNVPGVIIAQGTILKVGLEVEVSLYGYISTDGGQSWRQGLKGRHIYKLLDHGGLFAGIAVTNPFLHQNTNKVDYSCNGGRSWNSAFLPNQLSRVVGVAAHPAAKTNIMKIFGADTSDSLMFSWTIWKVNFSAVFDSLCSADSYTMWVAGPEKREDPCILGQRYVYKRRKEGICCSYGIDFELEKNISTCKCSMSDFECDFGFKREEIGGYCTPTSFASLNPPVNCPEGEEYIQSRGYIKIKGDKCQEGIEKEIVPVKKLCPARAPDGLSLSVQKYSIALGKTAEIILHQQSGFLGTKYTWDFGDGVIDYNLTFDVNKRYHKYDKIGTYVISVLASNNAGSFTAKTVMRVIERVSEVFLHVIKPVVAMEAAVYTAELISHGSQVADRHGFVHFAWIFEPIKTPVLSLNSTVTHTYDSPGTYEVEVRVFNAISVVSKTTSVTVFGDVRVLQLQFSSTLDLLNQGTKQWQDFFKLMVNQYLIKTFKIPRDMIETEVSKTLPTLVTLSLVQSTVPQRSTRQDVRATEDTSNPSDRTIDTVMQEIIDRVRNRKISFFLMGQEVRVLEANILRGKKERKRETVENNGHSLKVRRDLYIGLIVGGILILVSAIVVVMYCRRELLRRKFASYLEMPANSDQEDLTMNSIVET